MAKEKKVKNDNKSFMKDFKAELKKVVWPTSKQMVSNVTAVIAIVIITALIVFVLDLVFGAMNEYGVNKLKTHIISTQQTETQVIDEGASNTEDNSSETNNVENTQNNATAVENAENTTSEQNKAE